MFPNSKTSADRLYHWILLGACAAFIAGCGVQPEDEITACANVRCSAGTCRLIDGTPTCVCSPVEVVQGVECAAAIPTAADPAPDDFGDDLTTAAELPLGQAVAGTISSARSPADVDMFWMQTTPGLAYRFGCSGCSVKVLQSDGTVATKINNTWEFATRATGDKLYALATGARYARYAIYGDLVADDVPNTHQGAALAVEGTQTHHFEVNDDEDVFTFVADPDWAYSVAVSGDWIHSDPPTRVDIEARDGTVLATGNRAAGVRDQSGPLFIRMVTTTSERPYSWTFVRAPRDDYPDTPALAAPMTFPLSVQGTLEASSDTDAFSFVVPRDHGVTVSCGAALPAMCQVDILDSAGELVAENPDRQTIQLAAGTYVALVRGIGKYSLRLDWYDDYAVTSPFTVQASAITGEIDYEDDRDSFSFHVASDHFYLATCTSSTGACTASFYSRTRSGSEFRASYDDFGRITITVSGTVGPYEVNLEDLGYDAVPGPEAWGNNLPAFPSSVSGTFEVGWDVDCYAFDFGAGTYTFEQTAGNPMQVQLAGPASTLPATISFAPTYASSYSVCFAPAPWFTDSVRGSAGPYAVTMTSP